MLKLCFLLALGAVVTQAQTHEPFIVRFQWNYFNYTWTSPKAYEEARKEGFYVEGDNVITSAKVYKDRIYLAIPRFKRGVPVTLASMHATAIDGNVAPLLEPYPSWELQKVGDCSALQSVQNMEIDPEGRMWVLDSGRVLADSQESQAQRRCAPSLRIFDLENRTTRPDKQLRNFILPAAVADPRTAHLYDVVLDHEDGGMAYISDADPRNPGVIVFSLQNRTFWKVSHSSMFASKDGVRFNIRGSYPQQRFTLKSNIHGLALSPASTAGNRTLYYSPLSSFHTYSISTNVLKNKSLHGDIDSRVKNLGRKLSQSDAMVMSNTGRLYIGILGEDAVTLWDPRQSSFVNQRMISRDHYLMQWPASFAFDNNGTIWCITNRMHIFLNDSIYIREPNFRLINSKVSYTNYQYLEDGSAPPLPEIKSAGSSVLLSPDVKFD